ncbi:MAG: threonylcarbamoyl-AMP synthase [Victivallales bacterium]|nr:threonylcarbamoyl-AMP synthase [Victivallales bacterium]
MKKFDLRTDDIVEIIDCCVAGLNRPGAVLLLPTETVYGLVCRWDDKVAIERIYELKGREKAKPLALFADSVETLKKFELYLNKNAEKLAGKLCPGALTIVVPTPAGDTLGFRIPDHPFVLELLKKLSYPLASTSANRSGEANALDVDAALAMLDGEADVVIDGGTIPPDRQASTVVMALDDELKILRQGTISENQLNSAIRKHG